ncbi:hypothetical protein FACS18949_06160 [Clostridia bacterium]|nr:hypothetical protein FACS1894202_07440 [Clostridia bacterium]GHV33104.1 hypothetical protein FACS18949_06160 [Clostridia bacterium]
MRIKTITLMVATLMLLSLTVPLTANAVEPAPFYTNTAMISCSLTFSSDLALVYGDVIGWSGTTYISGTLTLQRKNSSGTYTDVKSWTASISGDELEWDKSWYVATGYYYRIHISAYVTRNGTTEHVTLTGNNVYCS